jgi:uncharacterized protein with beta-barrel porin domain
VSRIPAKRSTVKLAVEAKNVSFIVQPRLHYWALVAAACLMIGTTQEAAAQCATTGTNPVSFTCAANTTTTATTNTTSPNPSTSDATQQFAAGINGQVNTGVTVSGQGLNIQSTQLNSSVSFVNNGTVSTAVGPHALNLTTALGGTGSVTYSGTGNVTQTGTGDALFINAAAGSGTTNVTISGTSSISAVNGVGISFSGGNSTTANTTLTVQSGGSVTGADTLSGGAIGLFNATIINSGTISGDISVNQAVVTNKAGGIMQSAFDNFGVVTAANGLTLDNQSGATIRGTSAGPIGGIGVLNRAATLSLTNEGTISGTLDGVNSNGTAATVTNSNSITGTGRSGVRLNVGTVTNNTGATISGLNGIFFRAGNGTSSVSNDGTITGTGGTAIQFSTGSTGNTLTLGVHSVINGNVLGAGSDNLQLTGTTGTGTINVAQYQGFTTFTKSGGSTWLLTGTDATQNWIASAGVIGGNATIGALNIQTGATFMPGNGTAATSMTLNGNLTFGAGTTYLVNVNPATASSANVTGTASLTGGTVQTVFAAGSYVPHNYVILHTTGGLGGTTFTGGLTGVPAGFTAHLQYTATDVDLDVTATLGGGGGGGGGGSPPGSGLGNNGLNGNQQNIATTLNNFFNSGGTLPPGFLTLFGLTGNNLNTGLTQISGETATGSQQTTFNAMSQFMGLLGDPFIAGRGNPLTPAGGATPFASEDQQTLSYAARSKSEREAADAIYRKAPLADPFTQRWSVWAAGFGGSQTTDGNTALGSNNTTSNIAATAVGVDYRISPFTLAGFALAGGGTNFSVANGGSGRSDLFQAGAFLRHNVGAAYFTATLAYGWQDITTDRLVTVAGADRLHAEFNANAFSGRAEGGYRFVTPWAGGFGITPYAAAQFTTFDLPAYAEQALSGTNTFALAYGAKSVTDPRSELGIRTDKSYAMADGILTLRGRLAWAHDFDTNRNIAATFQSLPGASFVVNGAAQASDAALVTASVEKKWLNGWSAAATFEGEFSGVTRSYAGKGVVRYNW